MLQPLLASRRLLGAVLAFSSLVLCPSGVAAECIPIPLTVAEKLALYDVAFVGDVTETNRNRATAGSLHVTFNVLEPYKGSESGVRTMRLLSSAEDFRLEQGQRVLLLAHRVDPKQVEGWPEPPELRPEYAIACSPTQPVSLDDPQLTEYRRLVRRRRRE